MTRTDYMTAAAAAITEATGIDVSPARAEMLLGDCWDLAQREARNPAEFSACMKLAAVSAARMVRDLAA